MSIYTVSVNPAIDLFLDVPSVVYDDVLRATGVRRVWAGKGFNVSRALQRLGTSSTALGFVGGYAGMAICAGLESEGIASDFVRVEEETRTNVMIVEQASGRHIKVNQAGAPVTAHAQEEFLARVRGRLAAGDIWVLSGSLAPGLEPDFYARLIELVHAAGAHAILDTSGAALRLGSAARPLLVKPNTVEAHHMTGIAVDSIDNARRAVDAFHAAGAHTVALSLGASGLIYSDGDSVCHVQPPGLKVRTAVGAGDALLGGIVWALTQQLASTDAACWGVATAATYAIDDELPADAQPAVQRMLSRLSVTQLKP